MESIFDHDPTIAELTALYGTAPDEDAEFHAAIRSHAQKHGSDPSVLVRLFSLRGDRDNMERCLNLITDQAKRFEVEYLLQETA